MSFATLPDLILEPLVKSALMEDLGSYGDVTTRAVIPPATTYAARINAREAGVVSGMQIARTSAGGDALSIITIDQAAPEELVEQVGSAIEATTIRQIGIRAL